MFYEDHTTKLTIFCLLQHQMCIKIKIKIANKILNISIYILKLKIINKPNKLHKKTIIYFNLLFFEDHTIKLTIFCLLHHLVLRIITKILKLLIRILKIWVILQKVS